MARALGRAAFFLLIVMTSCTTGTRRSSAPPAGAPPPQAAYGQPPPPQQQPPGYGAPAPSSPPPAGAPQAQAPGPPVGYDPINAVDISWLRSRTSAVVAELIAALPPPQHQRVASIPFVFDSTPGEVNAFAACVDGKALLVMTDGLLDVCSYLAQARANDDVFGTRKVDEYIRFVAQNQRPDQPIVHPPQGFFPAAQQSDSRRVARQHDVFDELVGFILGHELAHHHLGHLPCSANGGLLGTAEIARAVSDAVPIFNQPNELAADTAGTYTVLSAGKRRSGTHWTEEGGLLTMQFFAGLDQSTPIDVIFAFERTHPSPQIRTPVIQQAANFWRMSGGAWVQIPGLGG